MVDASTPLTLRPNRLSIVDDIAPYNNPLAKHYAVLQMIERNHSIILSPS